MKSNWTLSWKVLNESFFLPLSGVTLSFTHLDLFWPCLYLLSSVYLLLGVSNLYSMCPNVAASVPILFYIVSSKYWLTLDCVFYFWILKEGIWEVTTKTTDCPILGQMYISSWLRVQNSVVYKCAPQRVQTAII